MNYLSQKLEFEFENSEEMQVRNSNVPLLTTVDSRYLDFGYLE